LIKKEEINLKKESGVKEELKSHQAIFVMKYYSALMHNFLNREKKSENVQFIFIGNAKWILRHP
jgi:hypothetical protein